MGSTTTEDALRQLANQASSNSSNSENAGPGELVVRFFDAPGALLDSGRAGDQRPPSASDEHPAAGPEADIAAVCGRVKSGVFDSVVQAAPGADEDVRLIDGLLCAMARIMIQAATDFSALDTDEALRTTAWMLSRIR